jgi:hypothetical protein
VAASLIPPTSSCARSRGNPLGGSMTVNNRYMLVTAILYIAGHVAIIAWYFG